MKLLLGLPRKNAIFFLAAFIIAFTFYCLIWQDAPLSGGDSYSYIDLGIKLKNDTMDSPHYRLVGYPIFLLLTGSVPRPIRATFYLQLIFHFICIWLLAAILLQINGSNLGYLLNLFCIILLLPPYVESAGYILTENLSQLTLVLLIYFIFYWYVNNESLLLLLIAGLFSAISFIVKPTYLLLSLALLPILYYHNDKHPRDQRSSKNNHKKLATICCLILPTILIIGVYCSYNYVKFEYFGITPRTGFQLFTKTVKFIEEIPDNHYKLREAMIAERDKSLVGRGSSHTGVQFIFGKGGSINKFFSEITGKKPEELDRMMMGINLSLIYKRPLNYISAVIESLSTIWFPSMTRLSFYHNRLLQLIYSIFHFALILLFFIYLSFKLVGHILRTCTSRGLAYEILNYKSNRDNSCGDIMELTAIIIILYTVVISSFLDVGNPRHLQPVLILIWWLIFIFAGKWQKMNEKV